MTRPGRPRRPALASDRHRSTRTDFLKTAGAGALLLGPAGAVLSRSADAKAQTIPEELAVADRAAIGPWIRVLGTVQAVAPGNVTVTTEWREPADLPEVLTATLTPSAFVTKSGGVITTLSVGDRVLLTARSEPSGELSVSRVFVNLLGVSGVVDRTQDGLLRVRRPDGEAFIDLVLPPSARVHERRLTGLDARPVSVRVLLPVDDPVGALPIGAQVNVVGEWNPRGGPHTVTSLNYRAE